MRRYLQKMSTSMDGEDAIVFCILDKETGVCGYTWFIESHRTSFYIKSTYKPLQTMKVSIHGPDPDHVGKQHFRFDFTTPEEARKAINAGGGWSPFGNPMPWYFTGRRVNKRTVQLARFSAERNMFRPGMQRGPDPTPKSKATLRALVGAPREGYVTHVDLCLSRVRPFWQNKEMKIRGRDAGMGPLVNDAGMYLTGVVSQRLEAENPDPFGDVSEGLPTDQLVRGVAAAVDTTGLLWTCEKMMPRAKLTAVAPPSPSGAPT
jgi:hypothetical protein